MKAPRNKKNVRSACRAYGLKGFIMVLRVSIAGMGERNLTVADLSTVGT